MHTPGALYALADATRGWSPCPSRSNPPCFVLSIGAAGRLQRVAHLDLPVQALLGANWPNQLQKHKLTRTATLAGLTKSTATSQSAPGQDNGPVSFATCCADWQPVALCYQPSALPAVFFQSECVLDRALPCLLHKSLYGH